VLSNLRLYHQKIQRNMVLDVWLGGPYQIGLK
jgi:hypothetical protein